MALQGAPRAEPAASVDQFMSSFLSAVIKIFTDPSPVSSLLRSSFFTHQRLLNISSFLFILINVLWCKCYRPVAQFLPSEGKGFPYCRHTHTDTHRPPHITATMIITLSVVLPPSHSSPSILKRGGLYRRRNEGFSNLIPPVHAEQP